MNNIGNSGVTFTISPSSNIPNLQPGVYLVDRAYLPPNVLGNTGGLIDGNRRLAAETQLDVDVTDPLALEQLMYHEIGLFYFLPLHSPKPVDSFTPPVSSYLKSGDQGEKG